MAVQADQTRESRPNRRNAQASALGLSRGPFKKPAGAFAFGGEAARAVRRLWRPASELFGTWVRTGFSSLTRRIVVFNLAALVVLVSGILYLNQFRAGLIDARVQSLLTQGEIIAGAIAASATIDAGIITIDPEKLLDLQAGESIVPPTEQYGSLEFPINPERAAPILRDLVSPTRTRAHLYDRAGKLIIDSRNLFASGQIISFELPPLGPGSLSWPVRMWRSVVSLVTTGELPQFIETSREEGKTYPEVVAALNGAAVSIVRVNNAGELVVIAAVPVQRFRAVLGALVLSTQGGDIDSIVSAERWAILRVFLVAAGVTILLSFLVAGTIAGPVRRLASAADRVRQGIRTREEIPDFTDRGDEIGHLSGSLREMTAALYQRMDAIEQFAADVAHELKNPLTSLRSATETLPLAKDDKARDRLIRIVQDDVRRLDRLISDISAASRLDAELSRQKPESIDMARLLAAVAGLANDVAKENLAKVTLEIRDPQKLGFRIMGQDRRVAQVINNLIDNSRSFAPTDSAVCIKAQRGKTQIEIWVEDDGPGIPADNLERIFGRFYTDRPQVDEFSKNSGLGLSISRQIIEAHGGTIHAENRYTSELGENLKQKLCGARFAITLPANDA
ncbi:MAG: stimulus-sensing domain-containing protein [Alphaproteobacteria bacterium]